MDENVIGQIIAFFIAQGLSGVMILGLGFAVYKLYNRNQELAETLREVGRESVKANEQTVAALNRLSDLLLRARAPK
jgi:hypothetical protein